MISILSVILLCFRTSSGGTAIKSCIIALGVLLGVLPLIVAIYGPNIASAKSMPFSTTGQSLIWFPRRIAL